MLAAPIRLVLRRARLAAVAAAVALLAVVGSAFAGIYPNPAHDFGPVAGAGPLYNATQGANPRPLLVIIVTFSDVTTPAGLTEAATAARVFGPAFPNLAGYYSANSFGKLTYTPAQENCGTANDGVVTVNVGSSATWLGLSEAGQDRADLDAVNALGCVDFSKFDRNNDGKLTDDELGFLEITSLQRGCGATRGITSGAVYNGKTIDPGKAFSKADSNTNVLTLAHEVGHQTLDTRDLYGFGVGSFDLYGPTCGPPDSTMFEFSAWQKLHLGWITPTVVDHDGYYDVRRADTTGDAFILYDPSRGTNDYFIVENREPTASTYDQNATDRGLVIWRADDSQYNSAVESVRPIDIMRPDGATNAGCTMSGCYGGSNGDAWDPSDAASPQRTMTRTWRDGTASNVTVRAIPDAGNTMRVYFDVRGPGVLVDTYALQHASPPDVALGTAGPVAFPVMNTGEATDTFDFTAAGLPAGWSASTDTQTFGAGAGSTAHITVTPPLTAATGLYTFSATGTSQSDSSVTSSSTFTVNVVKRPTTIVYTGDTTGDYHDGAHLTATLTDVLSGTPLASKPVDFTLGAQPVSAPTNGAGVASAVLVVNQAPQTVSVAASFAGDATYLPSSDFSHSFTITREESSLTYTGPTVVLAGSGGAVLTAQLVQDGANDDDGDGGSAAPSPAGQTITFTLGTDSCSGATGPSGIATCTISSVSGSTLGPKTLATSFGGDTYYRGSADSDQVIVFAFPSRGAFVLGNTTVAGAAPGATLTWWGSSWAGLNSLSGGAAPASFKGFAESVTTLPATSPASACGTTFATGPGNSSSPPDAVPSYMGVLVAGSAGKSGSTINGGWGKIVVVRVDPGYAGNPGHPGNGTVVATFC